MDLALLTLPMAGPDLEVVPVLKEEMVVVTAPGHPLARQRTVEPATLARFPLILYERGSNTRRLLDGFFARARVPRSSVAMETENVEIIKSMVAAGLGITLIPYAAIARDVRARRFAYVAPARDAGSYRETGWVYLRSPTRRRARSPRC